MVELAGPQDHAQNPLGDDFRQRRVLKALSHAKAPRAQRQENIKDIISRRARSARRDDPKKKIR
jgi:hypothetical protein